MKLSGIIPPLITPLREDESLDEAGLARLIEHVIAGGVSGIFVLGSSGEGPSLADEVKERVVSLACEQAKGRVPVLVGVFAVGTRQMICLAQRLTRCGGDALVLTAPYYYVQTQDEIVAHLSAVAGNVDLPSLVYNIPQTVKTIIEPETFERLAEVPEIIGIKDSLGDMVRFQRLLTIRQHRPEFTVFQGAEGVMALSAARGADGLVPGLANVAPALWRELFEAGQSGDLARAWALQERLMVLWKLHSHGQWLPCLKMAASQLGLCGPVATAPFAPLDSAAVEAIRADMRAAGVLPA